MRWRRSRRDERPSPIPTAQWELKPATGMAQELRAAVSSLTKKRVIFLSRCHKSSKSNCDFSSFRSKIYFHQYDVAALGPAVMKTLGYFGFHIFTVFCGIRIDLIVFRGMLLMAAHKHKLQYACGLYRQTSGDTSLRGNYFSFLCLFQN